MESLALATPAAPPAFWQQHRQQIRDSKMLFFSSHLLAPLVNVLTHVNMQQVTSSTVPLLSSFMLDTCSKQWWREDWRVVAVWRRCSRNWGAKLPEMERERLIRYTEMRASASECSSSEVPEPHGVRIRDCLRAPACPYGSSYYWVPFHPLHTFSLSHTVSLSLPLPRLEGTLSDSDSRGIACCRGEVQCGAVLQVWPGRLATAFEQFAR